MIHTFPCVTEIDTRKQRMTKTACEFLTLSIAPAESICGTSSPTNLDTLSPANITLDMCTIKPVCTMMHISAVKIHHETSGIFGA